MRIPRIAVVNLALLVVLALCPTCAFAGRDNLEGLDAGSLAQLEQRADHADPREQCFLYTELVHVYAEAASKQMAAGEVDQASASLKRVERFALRIHMGLARDTKRLKNAEMMMHAATRRLGDLMHHASSDDQEVVASTLKQLDKVNDELLAQVFAH